jgi:D-glycerate 3-kinase
VNRTAPRPSPTRSAAGKPQASTSLQQAVREKIATLQLPASFVHEVYTVYREIAQNLFLRGRRTDEPFVVGVCGCQGSGKSTLAAFLKLLLDWEGCPTAILSLDDLYLTRGQREKLAREIHPLLKTRGVPGTHDVDLGLKTLHGLRTARTTSRIPIPRFDKARDNRAPRKDWDVFRGRPAFILFEGWCVDAKPQPEAALRKPVNGLERDCDPDETWRRYVNDELTGPYQELFAPIDVLLFLRAPSFDCVYKWRGLQEKKLRRASKTEDRAVMDKKVLDTFIMHYERLTRWMLKEMPSRANILLPLAPNQRIRKVEICRPRSRRGKS